MKTEITCMGTKVNFVPVSCAQMQRNNLLYGDGMNYCSGMKVIIDIYVNSPLAAARLAQLEEHRSAEWEAVRSNPGRTNTQGL